MRCLRCRNNLLSVKEDRIFDHVSYDICEKCGGLWLDKGMLDKLTLQTYGSIELGSSVDFKEAEPELGDELLQDDWSHPPRKCLRCRDQTMARIRLMGDSKIILDYCRACQSIWLDGGELARINSYIKWFDNNAVPSKFGRFLQHLHGNFWHRIETRPSAEMKKTGEP